MLKMCDKKLKTNFFIKTKKALLGKKKFILAKQKLTTYFQFIKLIYDLLKLYLVY